MSKRDREGRLHDAVMSAAARDKTSDESGTRRDNFRAIMAIWKVVWRFRRAEKAQENDPRDP